VKKLFVLYVFLVIHFSLYPWRFQPAGGFLAGWHTPMLRSDYRDIVANLLFYLPFGALGELAWRNVAPGRRWLFTVAGGAALSVCLEVAQAWVPSRNSSLRDWIMNVLSTVAGLALARLVSHRPPGVTDRRFSGLHRPWPALLTAVWLTAWCFPFLPYLRRVPLGESLRQLLRMAPASWLDLADVFVGCLLLSYAMRCWLEKPLWRLSILLAFLVFPLRVFLLGNSFSWPQTAAAAIAFLLSIPVLAKFDGEAALLAGLTLLLLALKEFAPFTFSGTPTPFQFTPFSGFLESNRDMAIRIVAGKFFLYGSSVWLLREAGFGLRFSAGIVTLVLGAGEIAQRYLPGRVPESTDPLLALAAALSIACLKDRPSRAAEPPEQRVTHAP
jgi:VanZ family protein